MKPSNWYQMDYSEQQQWKKQQQAIEDAEYDARQARQNAEDEMFAARRQYQRDLQAERISASEEYNELSEYCEYIKGLLREYIIHLDNEDESNVAMKDWLDNDWLPRVRTEMR